MFQSSRFSIRSIDQGYLLFFLGIYAMTYLCSCVAEASASADWAKQKQAGNSPVTTEEKMNYNIHLFLERIYGDQQSGSGHLDNQVDIPSISMDVGAFGVQGGLEFVGKGAKYNLSGSGGSIGLNYLEVPIYGLYKYALNQDNKIYAGIASSYGENNGGYKRWDAGLTFEAGYQYKPFTLTFSYDLGLLNVAYPSQDYSAHNHSFAINAGYRFDIFKY